MKPHDLRAVAASLKSCHNCTLSEIMAAGLWRSPNTFITHYLKQFSRDDVSDLCSIGPFVAAGTIVG